MALNNLQWLTCHKTQRNQITLIAIITTFLNCPNIKISKIWKLLIKEIILNTSQIFDSLKRPYLTSLRWAALVICLALTFRSSPSQISSMGFMSADCPIKDIIWRTCRSFLLLMYLFGSLSYMGKNPWLTSSVPDGIAWYCRMLWKPVWFNLPFTWCKSSTLQLTRAPHPHATITEPLTCFKVSMIQDIAVLSPTLHRT